MADVMISRATLDDGVMKPIFLNSVKEETLKIGADMMDEKLVPFR